MQEITKKEKPVLREMFRVCEEAGLSIYELYHMVDAFRIAAYEQGKFNEQSAKFTFVENLED